MKKICIAVAVALMIFALAACSTTGSAAVSAAAVSGNTFDTGLFTVSIPEGWQEYEVTDMFSEDDSVDPSQLHVYKGTEPDDELYVFSAPGMQIAYFSDPSAVIFPDDEAFAAVYDNIEYIDDVVAGDHVFTAYTCTSEDVPQTVMWNAEEGLQVIMVNEMEGNTISVDDPDVISILASITIK